MQVGTLVERFNQTPYQLGITRTNDFALLYRGLEAVRVFSIAKKYQEQGLDALTIDEARLASRMTKEMAKQKKRKRRTRRA